MKDSERCILESTSIVEVTKYVDFVVFVYKNIDMYWEGCPVVHNNSSDTKISERDKLEIHLIKSLHLIVPLDDCSWGWIAVLTIEI